MGGAGCEGALAPWQGGALARSSREAARAAWQGGALLTRDGARRAQVRAAARRAVTKDRTQSAT